MLGAPSAPRSGGWSCAARASTVIRVSGPIATKHFPLVGMMTFNSPCSFRFSRVANTCSQVQDSLLHECESCCAPCLIPTKKCLIVITWYSLRIRALKQMEGPTPAMESPRVLYYCIILQFFLVSFWCMIPIQPGHLASRSIALFVACLRSRHEGWSMCLRCKFRMEMGHQIHAMAQQEGVCHTK